MRNFDEFTKIAKKQKYDEKEYPYGYRKRFFKRAELDEIYFAKLAADAPDIESEKEIIPRLTQEVTYIPPEKTPPTPGGKVTPSKYVQRKNKQRYQE